MGMNEAGTVAMKTCPFCAEDIRAEAVKCRYCGSDLSGRPSEPIRPAVEKPRPQEPIRIAIQPTSGGFMRMIRNITVLLLFIVLAAVVGTCVMCGKAVHDVSEKNKATSAEVRENVNAVDVSARELESAYAANEVAADQRFRGRVVRVTGVVDRISKDILDDPHVVLTSVRSLGGVTCSFGKGADASIAQLSKGQRVTLRGMGEGYFMGAPMLTACVVESGATARQPSNASVMAKMSGFKDQMCSCTTKACADRVQDNMNTWSAENARSGPSEEIDEQSMREIQALGTRYGECMAKAMTPPTGKRRPSTARTSARTDADLPAECRRYASAIAALSNCDKLPQATRNALRQSYEQTALAWASVPAEGYAALGAACESAADAVQQSAAACE